MLAQHIQYPSNSLETSSRDITPQDPVPLRDTATRRHCDIGFDIATLRDTMPVTNFSDVVGSATSSKALINLLRGHVSPPSPSAPRCLELPVPTYRHVDMPFLDTLRVPIKPFALTVEMRPC